MGVRFNHTIVMFRDTHQAAVLLARILGLSDPSQLGSMLLVGGRSAFRVCQDEFKQVLAHIHAHGLPFRSVPGERNAVCFEAPGGHLIQVMTTLDRFGDVPFSA